MSFKKRLEQNAQKSDPPPPPTRDWWSATGTGWGPNHDQPNPFAQLANRMKRDATETVSDVRDEPDELAFRLRERLRGYGDVSRGRRTP